MRFLSQAGVFAALAALLLTPGTAAALSCHLPTDEFFLRCTDIACEPLFLAEQKRTFEPCGWRWSIEPIGDASAEWLNAEIARRGEVPDGVLKVTIDRYRLEGRGIPDEEEWRELDLRAATIEAVPGSPQSVRSEWERRARRSLSREVLLWLPAWILAAGLFCVLFLATRSVWRELVRPTRALAKPLLGALPIQVALGLIGYVAYLQVRTVFSGWVIPIAFLMPAATVVIVAELGALGAKWVRSRLGPGKA